MPRIFYGWWIALATIAVYAIGGGFGFYSLTVFFAGFEHEFAWSRTELSGAISVSFFISGLIVRDISTSATNTQQILPRVL